MPALFSEKLKRLRTQAQFTQQKLAEMLFVDRSSIASWETGRRIPDAVMLARIAEVFGTDVGELLGAAAQTKKHTVNVIAVDEAQSILKGSLAVLRKALPEAEIAGFTEGAEAVTYAQNTPVDVAFLDVPIGVADGLSLCRELLKINPTTNVVFLTAHSEYSLAAWETGACAFLLKPLTRTAVEKALTLLRFPIFRGE